MVVAPASSGEAKQNLPELDELVVRQRLGEDVGRHVVGPSTEHLEHLEHLECSLQPSPPGCFTKKLSEARGNGIGFVTAGEAAPPS